MQSSLNDGKPTNKALPKIYNTATICFEYLQLEVTKLGEQKLHCGFHILLKGSLTVLCHKWGQSLQVLLHVSHEALLVKSWLLLKTSEKKSNRQNKTYYPTDSVELLPTQKPDTEIALPQVLNYLQSEGVNNVHNFHSCVINTFIFTTSFGRGIGSNQSIHIKGALHNPLHSQNRYFASFHQSIMLTKTEPT